MQYLMKKYLKNNKKNYPYYIQLFFSFLFAYIVLLAYNYIDYYYMEILQGNVENRTIKVQINNKQLDKVDSIYSNEYIENIYEDNSENIEYNYTIIVNKVENVRLVCDFLQELGLEIMLNGDVTNNHFYGVLMTTFKIFIILFYFLFVLFSVIIIKIVINKEKSKICILKAVGFSDKNIKKLVNSITYLVVNRIFVINVVVWLLGFFFLYQNMNFIKWQFAIKVMLLLVNYLIYILFLILSENKFILKRCFQRKNLIFKSC